LRVVRDQGTKHTDGCRGEFCQSHTWNVFLVWNVASETRKPSKLVELPLGRQSPASGAWSVYGQPVSRLTVQRVLSPDLSTVGQNPIRFRCRTVRPGIPLRRHQATASRVIGGHSARMSRIRVYARNSVNVTQGPTRNWQSHNAADNRFYGRGQSPHTYL
jgi:hypothetical protein